MFKKFFMNFLCPVNKVFSLFDRIILKIYSSYYFFQFKVCGVGLHIKRTSVILSPENISIGNNFSSMGMLYLYANEGEIVIGDNVSLNTNVQIGASGGRVLIGNDVLIAPNVVIRSSDHGVKASRKINEQPHIKGEIYIEDDVWIGSNAVITSNVTLAVGTVVGAGAVVTKSTKPYTIVAGVPAKVIANRT